jgi:hypothetical protein
MINRYGRSPVTKPGGPVVSLTTWGQRAKTVYFAIESIARGEALPSRLILWIDEVDLFNKLPATIRRLQRRGLEVRLCKNYGPHKKYYPYVESQDSFDLPLVTADDDILYPRYWLRKLVEANHDYRGIVNCYFAGTVKFDHDSGRTCVSGRSCHSTDPSLCHIAIGLAGIIYPPGYLMVLKRAGTAFQSCSPTQNDIWLHVMSLRSGYKVRQILRLPPYFSFQSIPGSQRTALKGRDHDTAISATFNESDIKLLRDGCGVPSS